MELTNYESKVNFIDRYFYLLAIVLPITSVLIIPSVQGTLPSYLLALGSILFIPFITKIDNKSSKQFLRDFFIYCYILIIICGLGQISLAFFSDIDFTRVIMNNKNDNTYLLRTTIFTQSIYLTAGIATFLYVKYFYKVRWDKYILLGALILALYGVYEFLYFLVFKENGDFLSNRLWNDAHAGSLFQTYHFGSQWLLRIKSLTGEPSMYAFSILPFWIYSIHTKKTKLSILFLVTLVLSTSTTAYIGMAVYFFVRITLMKFKDKISYILMPILIILILVNWETVINMYNQFIYSKLTLQSTSGIDRFNSFKMSLSFFSDLPIINQLFGVGFGYIRSTDLFSTFLVNIGIVGLLIFSFVYLFPLFKMENNYKNIGLKSALIVIYVTSMISVPEFSYLSMWLFLGIAYNQMIKRRSLE